MRKTAVAYALGKLMQVMGVMLLVPLGIGLWDNRHQSLGAMLGSTAVSGFIFAIALSLLVGSAVVMIFRRGRDLQGLREGYAIVTLGWIGLTAIACIPLFVYFFKVPTKP